MGILTTACPDWASGPWAWVPPVTKDRRFAVGLYLSIIEPVLFSPIYEFRARFARLGSPLTL